MLAHGTGALNIDACRVGTSGATSRSGKPTRLSPSGAFTTGHGIEQIDAGRWPTNVVLDASQAAALDQQTGGGASRFFPTFHYQAKAPKRERPNVDGVQHPTVKPLDLLRWLVRLVTPPGGLVLDPFAGSGTTAEACVYEHMRCITIEREAEYLPLIVARLTR